MTVPPKTRRLAVLPLAALAIGLPALPAFAGTSYSTGCQVANITSSGTSPSNGNVVHTTPHTSVNISPTTGTISAAAQLSWSSSFPDGQEACSITGGYTDTLFVEAGPGGPGVGEVVEIQAVMRMRGSVSTSGLTGEHYAHADVTNIRYSVADSRGAELGGELLNVSGNANAQDTEMGGVPYDSRRWAWQMSAGDEYIDGLVKDETSSTLAFDSNVRTMSFFTRVGEKLDISAAATAFVDVQAGVSDASSRLDEFSVKLTPVTPGVVLDRDDAPTEEPPTEPEATPLELVQDARAALTSYNLPKGITTAIGTKLAHAERDITAGANACDDLTAVSNQTAAQRGKKLTTAQADALSGYSSDAQDLLGC